MKDKNDAFKGLPKKTLIATLNFKGIWGFDKTNTINTLKTNKNEGRKGI